MCKRFTKIFGHKGIAGQLNGQGSDYMCIKCQGVLCDKRCVETSEELIIFDFGSKTTWFKYESENTGQLSMHPTVPSLINIHDDSSPVVFPSGEDPILTDSCPVCSKMLRRRPAAVGDSALAMRDKKRFTSAFTKLSLRGFHCFESSQLDSDETEYTAASLAPAILEENNAHSQGNTSDTANSNNILPNAEPYLFLMSHMLRRNAFLPGKNIPFVICEPHNQSGQVKKALVQAVFEELKVPG